MKKFFITMALGMSTLTFFAQETPKELYTAHNKGKFFFFWGAIAAGTLILILLSLVMATILPSKMLKR